MMLDDFTEKHFQSWLDRVVFDDERADVELKMRAFLREYPELLKDHSWTEIRSLAERW